MRLRLASLFLLLPLGALAQSTSPNLVTSYIQGPNGNQTAISDGGTVAFASTTLGQSTTVTFIVANRGTAAGSLTNVTLTGASFQVAGLPLLPAQIQPNQQVQFNVVFTPADFQTASGSLSIVTGSQTIRVTLQGSATGAQYSLSVVSGTSAEAVAPGGTIASGSTAIGSPKQTTVRVTNTGNASGNITSISVTGAAYQITAVPALPVSLPANSSATFTLVFAPSAPGAATGSLTVNNQVYQLSGTGIGATLVITANPGSTPQDLTPNSVLTFPATGYQSVASIPIRISNNGNAALTINLVNVTGVGFRLASPVPSPLRLDAGARYDTTIQFSPPEVGLLTGALQVETITINLRGVGNAPPSLPAVSFTGLGATLAPSTQPAVGITLAQAYGFDLSGQLTLTFAPDAFADDPMIQFATGGRTVGFQIPAGATQATFASGANTIAFQSGTVSGQVTLRAVFTTNNAVVTPNPAPSITSTISQAAPVLRSLQVSNVTGSSIELRLVGFATTRALSQITLNFTPVVGKSLQTTILTVPVSDAFNAWYQGTASRTVGSQFAVTISLNVAGDPRAIASISAQASNTLGVSNTVSANVP